MSNDQDVLKRLKKLEDKQQIREVIEIYSRGVDRGDTDVMRQVFWPDATFPLGPPEGRADQFIDKMFGEYVGKILISTHHLLGNTIIKLQGSTAFAETYAIGHHRTFPSRESNEVVLGRKNFEEGDADKQHSLIIGFRYIDKFEERNGTWKILERRLVFDWSHATLYRGIESGGLYEGTPLRGERTRKDACYAGYY